jgi:preprotein translocase subunit SecG
MQTALVVLHLVICMAMIIIVLLQTGKGSEIGAVFGGSSQALFGPTGGGTFFGKLTTGIAIVFMLTSLILAGRSGRLASESVMSDVKPAASAPAATETESQAVTEVPLEESQIPPVTAPAVEKETAAQSPSKEGVD